MSIWISQLFCGLPLLWAEIAFANCICEWQAGPKVAQSHVPSESQPHHWKQAVGSTKKIPSSAHHLGRAHAYNHACIGWLVSEGSGTSACHSARVNAGNNQPQKPGSTFWTRFCCKLCSSLASLPTRTRFRGLLQYPTESFSLLGPPCKSTSEWGWAYLKHVLQDQPETLANAGCQLWDLLTPLPKQCQPTFRIWQRGPKLGRWTVNCPCIPRIPCQLVSRVQFIYIKNARPRVVEGTRVVVMYLVQIIRKAATSCISTSQIAKDVGKCQFHRVLFQNHSWMASNDLLNKLSGLFPFVAGRNAFLGCQNQYVASRADWLQNGILCLKLCNFGKSGMAGWKHFFAERWWK